MRHTNHRTPKFSGICADPKDNTKLAATFTQMVDIHPLGSRLNKIVVSEDKLQDYIKLATADQAKGHSEAGTYVKLYQQALDTIAPHNKRIDNALENMKLSIDLM